MSSTTCGKIQVRGSKVSGWAKFEKVVEQSNQQFQVPILVFRKPYCWLICNVDMTIISDYSDYYSVAMIEALFLMGFVILFLMGFIVGKFSGGNKATG